MDVVLQLLYWKCCDSYHADGGPNHLARAAIKDRKAKRHTEAVQKWEQLLPFHKCYLMYYYYASSQRELCKYKVAIEYFTKALRLCGTDSDIFYERAACFSALSQIERAMEDFKKALALTPEMTDGHSTIGFCYARLKQHGQALWHYDRSLEMHPGYAMTLARRGQTHYTMNAMELAFKDLNKAIETDPDNSVALQTRSFALWEGNYLEEALLDANRAVSLSPRSATPLRSRALIYVALKRFDLALVDCERALELYPQDERALCVKGLCLAREPDNIQQALECCKNAYMVDTEDYVTAGYYARLLYKHGSYQDAINILSKIGYHLITPAFHVLTLARCCVTLKNWTGASQCFRVALSSGYMPHKVRKHVVQFYAKVLTEKGVCVMNPPHKGPAPVQEDTDIILQLMNLIESSCDTLSTKMITN